MIIVLSNFSGSNLLIKFFFCIFFTINFYLTRQADKKFFLFDFMIFVLVIQSWTSALAYFYCWFVQGNTIVCVSVKLLLILILWRFFYHFCLEAAQETKFISISNKFSNDISSWLNLIHNTQIAFRYLMRSDL